MSNKILYLCRGSAWGLGLFQSPWDCRRIEELNREAKVWELQQSNFSKAMNSIPGAFLLTDGMLGMRFSIFGGECSDIAAVRKHLDSGVLEQMVARLRKEVTPLGVKAPWPDANYTVVLLGACAMGKSDG